MVRFALAVIPVVGLYVDPAAAGRLVEEDTAPFGLSREYPVDHASPSTHGPSHLVRLENAVYRDLEDP